MPGPRDRRGIARIVIVRVPDASNRMCGFECALSIAQRAKAPSPVSMPPLARVRRRPLVDSVVVHRRRPAELRESDTRPDAGADERPIP